MALTTGFGLHFLWWYATNWSRLQSSQADPFSGVGEIFGAVKWALLGFGVFGLGWLWSLATGMALILEAKREGTPDNPQGPEVPPVLR
jgi:hypothetical protein